MYTHVMNVKIWSNIHNKCIDDETLVNEIKDSIVDKNLVEVVPTNNEYGHELNLRWRRAKWLSPFDSLIGGDIITDAIEYENDKFIYFHTQRVLEGIENYLKDNNFGNMERSSWKIIFHLSKPLATVQMLQKII